MPVTDVYASAGTFADPSGLASKLAATLMEVEGVPPIPLFKQNTATFVHETTVVNVNGDSFIPPIALAVEIGHRSKEPRP